MRRIHRGLIPVLILAVCCPAWAAQFSRPASDHDTDSWTITPLWSKVDDPTSSTDGSEIGSVNNPNDDTTDDVIFTSTTITDPVSSTGHILRAVWHKNASGGRQMDMRLRLYQGDPNASGTLIATLTATDVGFTDQTDAYTLSGAEADNITDYSDLYLRGTGDVVGGGPGRTALIEAVEFETPDAPAGGRDLMILTTGGS